MQSPLIKLRSNIPADLATIINTDALSFITELEKRFGQHRINLLAERQQYQKRLDQGELPSFLDQTRAIRTKEWTIRGIPDNLLDRRVEITGPVDRKMMINALNSGADVFMADFEDAHAPRYDLTLKGQQNVRDAFNDNLTYTSDQGEYYQVSDNPAILFVRVRGWHLFEKMLQIEQQPISASLFDFGLTLFHNHQQAQKNNKGLYFYLPKIEHYKEASLWNEVFSFSEEYFELPKATIKCTVLIETLPAIFQLDEILYQLCDYIVGLNAGRWDYIFNFIKRMHSHRDKILPNRDQVTMDTAFLRAYSRQLIKVCHRRGALALGGMAAQIPIKNDKQANLAAEQKILQDKQREVQDGHDGTWVAHPATIPLARKVFDKGMPQDNQITKALALDNIEITTEDLLEVHQGTITEQGIDTNIRVALLYIAAWIGGRGAVPIDHLMEDTATAEISRAQLWQWLHNEDAVLDNGHRFTKCMFDQRLQIQLNLIYQQIGSVDHLDTATKLLKQLVLDDKFHEFFTLLAYDYLDTEETP